MPGVLESLRAATPKANLPTKGSGSVFDQLKGQILRDAERISQQPTPGTEILPADLQAPAPVQPVAQTTDPQERQLILRDQPEPNEPDLLLPEGTVDPGDRIIEGDDLEDAYNVTIPQYKVGEIEETPAVDIRKVLDFIGNTEAPLGYNQLYGENKITTDLSKMTLNEVLTFQDKRVDDVGFSALGRYQFVRKTLRGLKRALNLKGTELFTPELQDKLATALLKQRGWDAAQEGKLSKVEFAENLAQEWASFPVHTERKGANRKLKPGQSYYAGDGVNKALVSPDAVLEALEDTPVYRAKD